MFKELSMAHFIFSVVVVLLWLVAWGIYLVFGKRVKHPNAKAIGLPRLMLGESLVLVLCP